MVTVTNVINIHNGKEIVEIKCLSTDAKPTQYGNGSVLMEMDTSTLYMFDEKNNTWRTW